jgi:hypothetical protein
MKRTFLSKELTPFLLVISVAVIPAACGQGQQAQHAAGGPPPAIVSVAKVEVRNIAQWDESTGRIEAIEMWRSARG